MMKAEALDIRANEEIIEEKSGDTWKTPKMTRSRQVSGKFYFTNQRIAFRTWGPFKKECAYDIEYNNIDTAEPYTINLFIRTGIKVTTFDGDVYKLSVLKRNKYMELIEKYK